MADRKDTRVVENQMVNQNQNTYWQKVKELVEETKFGTISIVIQDGKIVQVEQNKKIRF